MMMLGRASGQILIIMVMILAIMMMMTMILTIMMTMMLFGRASPTIPSSKHGTMNI